MKANLERFGDYDKDGLLDIYIANYADLFQRIRTDPRIKRGPKGRA